MARSPVTWCLNFSSEERKRFRELAQNYFETAMSSLYWQTPPDTWIRQMYSRWRIMTAIEECQRGLKPQHTIPTPRWIEPEFYDVDFGDPFDYRRYEGDFHVPAAYASDEVLTEPKVICDVPRCDFDRPVTLRNGEQASIRFEFEIKEPTRIPDGLTAMFGYIPQPPSQPEIVCPCCKGSGKYIGFLKVEPCEECKGSGKVKGPDKKPDKPDID